MSKRILRLIAPFRCQFNLDSGKMVEEGENFNAFLKSFNADFENARERQFPNVPEGVTLKAILRINDPSMKARYLTLDQNGKLFNTPKHFSVTFDQRLQGEIAKYANDAALEANKICAKALSNVLTPILETLDIAVYEKTVAILSIDLAVDDQISDSEWMLLDEWTTRLMFFFLDPIYRNYLFPAFLDVNKYVQNCGERRIRNPHEYFLMYDMSDEKNDIGDTRLLWVNRTLICPTGETSGYWTMRHMDAANAINVNGSSVHTKLRNNVIETAHGETPADFSGVWEGLYLAEYYYAVMDVISKNLKRFISATYYKKKNYELRTLSRAMDYVINSVTIFEVECKDLPMELQGLSKAVYRRLEQEWDLPALIQNVQGKRDLCKMHGDLLTTYISQRNSIRVEMVLTGVAGVGLIGLMMNLSSYGRALAREGYRNDVVGLLDIGQYLSPSVMIWIGIFMAIAISVFVSMNRTR